MTPEQVQALVRGELSGRSKLLHTALLVAALAMASVVTSVWVTEPSLPMRTHGAFAAVVIIALGWSAHALWVLTQTAILLVPHQVQAARLSMAACVVFLGGCLMAWMFVGGTASVLAMLSAGVMTSVAVLNFRRASGRYRALMRRRDELRISSEPGCSENKESA